MSDHPDKAAALAAHRAGSDARKAGEPREANPHPNPGPMNAPAYAPWFWWDDGWRDPIRTLEDGTEVTSYQPSNGTEGEGFMAEFCNRCVCEPRDPDAGEGCPILTATMISSAGDEDYPPEWVETVAEPHRRTCTAFRARPSGWDGAATNPHAVAAIEARYQALPRDPVTGRPVIA